MSEIFVERSTGLSVLMDDGKVERVVSGADFGAGLRLIDNFKTYYGHSNQVNEEGLMPLAKNLAAMPGGKPGRIAPFGQHAPA